MPRIESEVRSRDLAGMLAELTITEDPVPEGEGGLEFTRLLTISDMLVFSEDVGYTQYVGAQQAYAVPVNRLLNSRFLSALDEWGSTEAGAHTIEIDTGSVQVLSQARAGTGLRVNLTGSTGAGVSEVVQELENVTEGSISFEAWVRLPTVSGAEVRLLTRVLDPMGAAINTSTIVTQSAMAAEWQLIQVEDYDLVLGGVIITVSWTTPSEDGGAPISSYRVRYRETGTTNPWTEVSVGLVTSYVVGNLMESTQYDVQVQAVNSVGDSLWSPPQQITTGTV